MSTAVEDGYYMHPDGTRFRRTRFGYWAGSDGSQVDEKYIEFRIALDSVASGNGER